MTDLMPDYGHSFIKELKALCEKHKCIICKGESDSYWLRVTFFKQEPFLFYMHSRDEMTWLKYRAFQEWDLTP